MTMKTSSKVWKAKYMVVMNEQLLQSIKDCLSRITSAFNVASILSAFDFSASESRIRPRFDIFFIAKSRPLGL